MRNRQTFEKKVSKSLNNMEAKLSFLNDGVKGLSDSFREFREDMVDYMAYSSEQFSDHEKRIQALEQKSKP